MEGEGGADRTKIELFLTEFIESPRAHSPLLAAESASIKNLP
jgi:hypothetical protein